jgi:asparagine synthase (glutamine-hydrolysing)
LLESLYNLEVFKIQSIDQSLNLYDKLIYYLDEPIADAAIIPAYELARISREKGKIVMLSGMGGDEIDGGYSRHLVIKNLFFIKLLRFLPLSLLVVKGKIKRNLFRLKAFAKEPKPENYFALTAYLTKTEIDQLTGDKWFPNYSKKINDMCKSVKGNKKYFYLDFKGFLASHNLIYMDKASMAASVEVRVPLLDKDLASSFFQNINSFSRFKLKPRLKIMLKNKLGDDYKSNKKEGFRYPYYEWLRSEINWNEIVIYFESLQLINTRLLNTWVKEIENDIDSVGMKLLYVYTLYRWMKIFNVKT